MKNLELARLFHEMADIYELKGVKWKPRAYRTVAKALETLPTPVEKFHKKKALEEIPGVGESIKAKIIESSYIILLYLQIKYEFLIQLPK